MGIRFVGSIHSFIFLLLISCNGIGTAEFKNAGVNSGGIAGNGSNSSTFSGLTSITDLTDSTLTLNWISHPSAVAYDIFDVSSGSMIWKQTVIGQSTTSVGITGLTPGQQYMFRVRMKDSMGGNDSNVIAQVVTMNVFPSPPTSLIRISPSSATGLKTSLVLRVHGTKNGDTVRVYSDSSCSSQVASGTSTGTTIDLTVNSLIAGSHTFYARAENSSSSISACSTSSVAYHVNSCPANFISVIGSSTFSTNDFCVAKFEMKNVAGVPTSQAALVPWSGVSLNEAFTYCGSLGSNYGLLSNPEWMTIAYEIEKTASNWSGGSLGSGAIFKGHTDNSPAAGLEVSDVNDPYVGTGNSAAQAMGSGREQKRTHTLSNGEIIWDFSGNVWESVDWTVGGGLAFGPTTCTGVTTELPLVNCAALSASDYFPNNPAGISTISYNSNFNLGRFYGGSGGAARRGGAYSSSASFAGIFALGLDAGAANLNSSVGFRCVYRP